METQESLKTQVGGTHYKRLKQQPIELIIMLNMDFIQGNIVKYISRNKGNKLQDLEKARHYCELALKYPEYSNKIARHYGDSFNAKNKIINYVEQNNLSDKYRSIIYCTWEYNYERVRSLLNELIKTF